MTERCETNPRRLPESVAAYVRAGGDRVSVVLVGDIDGYTGAPILRVIDEAVPYGGGCVALDMSRIGFLDVAGLRMLLRAHQLSAQRGARLVLEHPAAHIRWLFQFTDTAELLLDETVAHHPRRRDGSSGDPVAALRLTTSADHTGIRQRQRAEP